MKTNRIHQVDVRRDNRLLDRVYFGEVGDANHFADINSRIEGTTIMRQSFEPPKHAATFADMLNRMIGYGRVLGRAEQYAKDYERNWGATP